jgi:alkylation response protein AidB-like acyl-CoA dehydrogenase
MAAQTTLRPQGKEPRADKTEIIRRATELVPVLKERSARCEELRRLPDETIADFVAAELHKIAQPVRFGGLGFEIDTAHEVALEIGRACGSSAWVVVLLALHNWMIGLFPEPAQKEYWANSQDVLAASASAVISSRIEQVPGGLRISGRWGFSSGVDFADWLIIMTPGSGFSGFMLIPKVDYRVVDDWYVAGLRGSGSKAVVIDDAFVPHDHVVPGELLMSGRTAGSELYGSPFYKLPVFTWFGWNLAAPLIGMAQGVVDLFEERTRGKVNTQTGERAIERPANQLRLAEASAEVDAARMILLRNLRQLAEWGEGGVEIPLVDRARVRRDIAYTVKLSVQAANRLYDASGAHAIYDSSPMQRLVRDISTVAHHVALTWDEPAEAYARVRWGLSPNTFQI